MALKKYFRAAIPKGMALWYDDLDLAGVSFRPYCAQWFAKGSRQTLYLKAEPDNPHDPNAIKIIGAYYSWWSWKHVHLGYVPEKVASEIAMQESLPLVRPRLRSIWSGVYYRPCTYIHFDILGPRKPEEGLPPGVPDCLIDPSPKVYAAADGDENAPASSVPSGCSPQGIGCAFASAIMLLMFLMMFMCCQTNRSMKHLEAPPGSGDCHTPGHHPATDPNSWRHRRMGHGQNLA